MPARLIIVGFLAIALLAAGCGGDSRQEAAPVNQEEVQQARMSSSSSDWINLSADPAFWTMNNPDAWKFENNVMSKGDGGGYIWTERTFGDFVLETEFKVEEGGNSGIFFRTEDIDDPVQTGIEIQVYNTERSPEPVKNDCGAVYDLMAPSEYVDKPAGQWNSLVLTCIDNMIMVTMNGVDIIEMDLNDWTTPGKNPDGTDNKFSRALKDFAREGHIGLQDHGDPVMYRNIRIKEL